MEEISNKMNEIEEEANRLKDKAYELEKRKEFLENLVECVTHGHNIQLNTVETSTSLEEVFEMGVWCTRCGCWSQGIGPLLVPGSGIPLTKYLEGGSESE